jgi:putative acetyltransferase
MADPSCLKAHVSPEQPHYINAIGALHRMEITVREAQPADAEQLIAHVQRLSAEPGINIALSPGEFTLTVAEEQKVLTDYAKSDNSIFLVAEVDTQIVGILNCKGGTRRATHHVVTLGMSVDRAWRNQGVGSQLMARATEWARGTGIVQRVELFVFARNKMAIHLYRKFGFEVEGRLQRAMFRDGEYLDDLIMALLL